MPDDVPRAYRLYHFTRSFEVLLKILETPGFRVGYCAEDFGWLVGQPHYLMTPMVSFCDIPLENAATHRLCYGQYGVGLSKKWGDSYGLNPLFYVNERSAVAETFRSFKRAMTKTPICPDDFGSFWGLLPYLKPTLGGFPLSDSRGTEIKAFDEEMEWRYVHPDVLKLLYNRPDDEQLAEQERVSKNQAISSDFLKFTADDIEAIIVTTQDERDRLSDSYPALEGRVLICPPSAHQ